MTIFMEYADDLERESEALNAEIEAVSIMTESMINVIEAQREYNYKQAESRVMLEHGTVEDLEALYMEAEEKNKTQSQGPIKWLMSKIADLAKKLADFINKHILKVQVDSNEETQVDSKDYEDMGLIRRQWESLKGFVNALVTRNIKAMKDNAKLALAAIGELGSIGAVTGVSAHHFIKVKKEKIKQGCAWLLNTVVSPLSKADESIGSVISELEAKQNNNQGEKPADNTNDKSGNQSKGDSVAKKIGGVVDKLILDALKGLQTLIGKITGLVTRFAKKYGSEELQKKVAEEEANRANKGNNEDANANGNNGNEANGNEANAKDAKGNEANAKDANGKDANGNEANAKDAKGNEANAKDANGKDANGNEANAKDAKGKDARYGIDANLSSAVDDIIKRAIKFKQNKDAFKKHGLSRAERVKWKKQAQQHIDNLKKYRANKETDKIQPEIDDLENLMNMYESVDELAFTLVLASNMECGYLNRAFVESLINPDIIGYEAYMEFVGDSVSDELGYDPTVDEIYSERALEADREALIDAFTNL